MIDDQLVLKIERLRDSLEDIRGRIRAKYKQQTSQVVSDEIRTDVAKVAEAWMVDVTPMPDVASALGEDTLADLNVHFQRLLTYSEQATIRKKYEATIKGVLSDFRAHVIIPLKQARDRDIAKTPVRVRPLALERKALSTVFVGHSFAKEDDPVNTIVLRFLAAYGLEVVTGEKPSANTVSAKVRTRIDSCDAFLGIFSRRDKIARKQEWLPSPWVVDEKAFALAKNKKLILLRESGVQSIGGLQGDYEYLEFDRTNMGEVLIRLLETLRSIEGDITSPHP
jgi:hypothetical protein